MQITLTNPTPTKAEITIAADSAQLAAIKQTVVGELSKDVNMAGFRKGHAPANLVEKNIDTTTLQSRFLDAAVNELYVAAIVEEKLRPVAQPEVEVTKFVPFDTLEMKATVDILGPIKLADYKKLKVEKKSEATTDKDVEAVLADLLVRDASKQPVDRMAADGDEVVIDFKGVDTKTKEAISGAEGKGYPLTIGSNTFIPGFEPELIGLKAGDDKSFDVTFPADYGQPSLQSQKVNFTVTVHEVREVAKPALDDAFASKVGPFKDVAELKTDIKKQLTAEKENQSQRQFESDMLQQLAEKSSVDLPTALVEEEIDRMEAEERQNLMYRGLTWQEHLDAEGKTAEQHREGQREQAILRVKSGLVLGEVAQAEKISVSEEELDERIADLKSQYSDAQMQAELVKPENRRDIASRILTEKTIARLTEIVRK